MWIELQQNKLIFRDRAHSRDRWRKGAGSARHGETGVGWQETTRGTSPRSIQVFRMRNSRVALHRHFHFRVKLENTGAHTPLHTARARRRERDDRPLVIPYRRFDDRREQRMQRTHTKRPIFRLNIISNSRDDGSENEKKKKEKGRKRRANEKRRRLASHERRAQQVFPFTCFSEIPAARIECNDNGTNMEFLIRLLGDRYYDTNNNNKDAAQRGHYNETLSRSQCRSRSIFQTSYTPALW